VAGRQRRLHGPDLKATVALAAVSGEKSAAQLAREFGLHPNVVRQWRDQLLANAAAAFSMPSLAQTERQELLAKIGALELRNDFLERASASTGWQDA